MTEKLKLTLHLNEQDMGRLIHAAGIAEMSVKRFATMAIHDRAFEIANGNRSRNAFFEYVNGGGKPNVL